MPSPKPKLSPKPAPAWASQPKPSKYGNKPCVIGGEKYRSQREAKRHQQLLVLQRAGLVANLKREVPFQLAPSVRYAGKRATPALRYVADFVYTRDGAQVVEDCKGFRTEAYKVKKHLMLAVHGIELLET